MQLVALLRELLRLRWLVFGALILSIALGASVAYKLPSMQSRSYTVGVASATAMVDTPRSQVVDLGGQAGADPGTLSARAALLANLMTDAPIKDQTAKRAAIPARRLLTPDVPGAGVGAETTSGDGASDPKAIILRTSVATQE